MDLGGADVSFSWFISIDNWFDWAPAHITIMSLYILGDQLREPFLIKIPS